MYHIHVYHDQIINVTSDVNEPPNQVNLPLISQVANELQLVGEEVEVGNEHCTISAHWYAMYLSVECISELNELVIYQEGKPISKEVCSVVYIINRIATVMGTRAYVLHPRSFTATIDPKDFALALRVIGS